MIEIILVTDNQYGTVTHTVSEWIGEWTRPEWIVMGPLGEEWKPVPRWSRMTELKGVAPVAIRVQPLNKKNKKKWEVKAFLFTRLDDYPRVERFGKRGKFVEIEIIDDEGGVIPPEEREGPRNIRSPQTKEERWGWDER